MDTRRLIAPASMFGMVLGLSGLGNAWRVAARWWGLPAWVGEAVLLVAAAVWLGLMLLFIFKWVAYRPAALAEVAHPVQCCFVALVPVSTMLMAIALAPHAPAVATGLLAVGAVGAVAFGVWFHGAMWRGGRNPATTTPALYLPTVAVNLVAAVGTGALGAPELGQVFFGAGLLAWLAMESVVLHRLLIAEEMTPPLRATLGIQLAPPCLSLLALVSVTTGPPDLLMHILLGYGLLQTLLVTRMLRWIMQLPLASYWGVSFGLTALATAVLRLAERGGDPLFTTLAPFTFLLANGVVGALFLASVVALLQGKLFPAPPVPAVPAGAAVSPGQSPA